MGLEPEAVVLFSDEAIFPSLSMKFVKGSFYYGATATMSPKCFVLRGELMSFCTESGSSLLCVVHPLLATVSLWAGIRTKSKWSPGPEARYWVSCSLLMTVGLFPHPASRPVLASIVDVEAEIHPTL
ncbi:hypothetical protein G6M50_24050 [Agrobacterium rhizogenes]|nr:hypothetical protein [Rhizobium rhizogenes]